MRAVQSYCSRHTRRTLSAVRARRLAARRRCGGRRLQRRGTPDLAVAAFGWRKWAPLAPREPHDRLLASLLRAQAGGPAAGRHPRDPGGSEQGRPDGPVAVFAQQFEQVVAFINDGTPQVSFTPQVIYTGPHPNWGSSGIQVVDLDGDGDLDVLLTHGDTFDDAIIKPYHGIQWLENKGTFPFTATHARRPAGREPRPGGRSRWRRRSRRCRQRVHCERAGRRRGDTPVARLAGTDPAWIVHEAHARDPSLTTRYFRCRRFRSRRRRGHRRRQFRDRYASNAHVDWLDVWENRRFGHHATR